MRRPSLSLILLAAAFSVGPGLARAGAADQPASPATTDKSVLYTLTVTDELRIDVVGQDDLRRVQRVDALGNIEMPYVGQIHVAGLTRDQAQNAIAQAYVDQRYLVHPQVQIAIDEYALREVSIQGQVKNPGRFTLPAEGTMSVVELVTKAGGFTDIAKGTDVIVTHGGGAGEKKSVIHVDVKDIIEGKGSVKANDPSLLLQSGDIVYVPESLI